MALLSAVGLLWEIDLTRFASVLLSYHYAFVAVSLAICGAGIGAALLYALPELPARRLAAPLSLAATIAFLLVAVLLPPLAAQGTIAALAALALLPFLALGGAVVALFRAQGAGASWLYGADLVGAGLGTLAAIGGLNTLGPFGVLLAGAALAAVAALLLGPRSGRTARRGPGQTLGSLLACGSLLALVVQVVGAPLTIDFARMADAPPDKTIVPVLRDASQHARVIDTRWDAFARTDVVATADPSRRLVFTDGGAGSYMAAWNSKPASLAGLRTDLESLPLLLGPHERVLVIGAGGGIDILRALATGARQVTAVELNGSTVAAVRAERRYNGGILDYKGVTTVVDDGRHFLAHTKQRYDVILLNLVYSGAAEGTSNALAESYIFTTEAFRLYLDHLSPQGRVGVISHQALEGERAFLTGLEALHQQGYSYANALSRAAVLMTTNDTPESRPTLTIFQRAPLTQRPLTLLRTRAIGDLNLQPIYVPFLFQGAFKKLAAGQQTLSDFLQGSDYSLAPTTDDRPFFFDLDNGLPEGLASALWAAGLLVAAVLALVFLLREGPPALRGQRRGAIWSLGAYMALLGFGFMGIEVPLIQRFILLLGPPVVALVVVLGTLLLAGGVGSLLSGWLFMRPGRSAMAPASAAVLILAWLAVFAITQPLLLTLGLAASTLWAVVLLLPLGLLLGTPFPLGMRLAAQALPGDVALFWSVNALFSVLGSVVAATIAVKAGFNAVLLSGVLCYILASLVLMYQLSIPVVSLSMFAAATAEISQPGQALPRPPGVDEGGLTPPRVAESSSEALAPVET